MSLFKFPKNCNINFWIENDPPTPLELFRKFIRPLILVKVISSNWGRLLLNVSTIFGRVDAVLLISRNQVDKSAKVHLEGVEGAKDKTEQENAEGGRTSY